MHAAVAQSLLVRRRSSLAPFVVLSVAAHIVAIAITVAIGLIPRSAPIDLNQKPIKASLVRLGKERDKKLLPRKEEPAPPPPEVKTAPPPPAPAAEPPPKAVETVPIPGVQKPPPPAASKQAGEKAAPPKKSLADAFGKFAAKEPEELEGASDGDPLGDSATQEGERYYGALTAQIRRYYDVSSTISEQERMRLRAEVAIRIGTRGELLDARVVGSGSGNDVFDSAVVAAAKKAAPFAPPPEHLRKELAGRGIILEFSP